MDEKMMNCVILGYRGTQRRAVEKLQSREIRIE